MSLWIRLCNHTYIHTYIQTPGRPMQPASQPSLFSDTHSVSCVYDIHISMQLRLPHLVTIAIGK